MFVFSTVTVILLVWEKNKCRLIYDFSSSYPGRSIWEIVTFSIGKKRSKHLLNEGPSFEEAAALKEGRGKILIQNIRGGFPAHKPSEKEEGKISNMGEGEGGTEDRSSSLLFLRRSGFVGFFSVQHTKQGRKKAPV